MEGRPGGRPSPLSGSGQADRYTLSSQAGVVYK